MRDDAQNPSLGVWWTYLPHWFLQGKKSLFFAEEKLKIIYSTLPKHSSLRGCGQQKNYISYL